MDGLIEIFLEHPSLKGKVGRDGYRFLFVVVRKYLISGINPFSLDDLVPDEGRRLHHGERGIFLPYPYAFRARFSHFSLSLTSPSGREYITNVVKRGDSKETLILSIPYEGGYTAMYLPFPA
jgi:hypothetical protein